MLARYVSLHVSRGVSTTPAAFFRILLGDDQPRRPLNECLAPRLPEAQTRCVSMRRPYAEAASVTWTPTLERPLGSGLPERREAGVDATGPIHDGGLI